MRQDGKDSTQPDDVRLFNDRISKIKSLRFISNFSYTSVLVKEIPQPQLFAFGFWNTNPVPLSPSV